MRALAGRGRPARSSSEIARELRLPRKSERILRPLLRSLLQEGRIERTGDRYRLPRADGLVEGRLEDGSVVEDTGAVWHISNPSGARRGDRVLLVPSDPSRRHGDVLGVVEGSRETWVGIYHARGRRAEVTPYRDEGDWRIPIDRRDRAGAADGDVVVVARGPGRGGGGRVLEVLGPPGSPEADCRAVSWRHRLPAEFSDEVLAAADAIPEELDPREIARRVDLRDRPFVTIDPASARDHDDAVSVEATQNGGARLWVAIADVSHYVVAGSPIDLEALRRGNSVYFPDRVIPMLPERLSGDLCSLRPGRDRLALVVELQLDKAGAVTRRGFYPAVIRSRARLSYAEAAQAMDGKAAGGEASDAWVASLQLLGTISHRLTDRRIAAGSLDFDIPSAELVLGDDGRPVDIRKAERSLANRAIEESMLAANRAVAEALEAAGVSAIYRNHEPPGPDENETLGELFSAFGLLERGWRRGTALSPLAIAGALRRIEGQPAERLVHGTALRCMRRALYEAHSRGHFALAFPHYLHFTSPIRRYADLVVHRALGALLAGGVGDARPESLEGVAARISWCERVATEAEREVVDLAKCAFMAPRVGREFDGSISGVARHGLYVTLDEWFVDGLVHVSTLPGYFRFDEKRFTLVAKRSGVRFRLGDRLRIRVDAVDLIAAHINFSIVSE